MRKGYEAQKAEVDPAERSRVVRITTGGVDRDREVLRPDGGDFEEFLKNPVVLFAHDYRSVPVGKCVSLERDGRGIVAKTVYNNTPLAREIYQLAVDGFPLAVSVGFIPLESVSRGEAGFGEQVDECVALGWFSGEEGETVNRVYTRWTLLEYSDVPVPANPEALQLAVSKGWIKTYVADGTEKGHVLSTANHRAIKAVHKACEEIEASASRCHKTLEEVLDSVTNTDDDDKPAREDETTPLDSAHELKEVLAEAMERIVADRVKASSDELLSMVARATGRHIEL